RGWLYRGHDVMPWCPRCGTGLSEHEIATEGYAEKTHLAVTVAFPLPDRPGEALLAWTTTPWTLPANVAVAVNPELTYVRVEPRTENREPVRRSLSGRPDGRLDYTRSLEPPHSFWLAKGALETRHSSLVTRHLEIVEERKGADLVGWRYTGPFDELEAQS